MLLFGIFSLSGWSTSPIVRPIRLGLWVLRWRYTGLDELVMLGASGLYTSVSNTSGLKRGAGPGGSAGRIPEVTMVGTELGMEFGGGSIPEGCSGGRGGGGPATGGRLGGSVPGGGTGGRMFTGGGFRSGGGGSPGGGGSTPGMGGGWKGSIFGKFTSSTTTGSLPWSNGHMSPRMQKPFSS